MVRGRLRTALPDVAVRDHEKVTPLDLMPDLEGQEGRRVKDPQVSGLGNWVLSLETAT